MRRSQHELRPETRVAVAELRTEINRYGTELHAEIKEQASHLHRLRVKRPRLRPDGRPRSGRQRNPYPGFYLNP